MCNRFFESDFVPFYRIQINGKSYFFQAAVSIKASVIELNSVKTNLKNQIKCSTKGTNCLCSTDSPGYHLVGSKCIYYEKTRATWENAKKGCKDKFLGGGRLYEPLSLQEHNEVFAVIDPVNTISSGLWIGVDDLSQEGSHTYSSSGSRIPFNLPWYNASWGSQGSGSNCILLYDGKKEMDGSNGSWLEYTCSSPYPSVCESE
jgi:hypothetical protein